MRWLVAIVSVSLLACSESGRRRDNNNNNNSDSDASVEQPSSDLGIGLTDLAGKSPADQAAASTLTGTIEIQSGGYAYAYFAWIAAGGGGSVGGCVRGGSVRAGVRQSITGIALARRTLASASASRRLAASKSALA